MFPDQKFQKLHPFFVCLLFVFSHRRFSFFCFVFCWSTFLIDLEIIIVAVGEVADSLSMKPNCLLIVFCSAVCASKHIVLYPYFL